MNRKVTTIIEQFGVVNGAWRNAPHNQVAVRAPKTSYTGKGDLFVLAEAQGQISKLEVVEKHLVALVRDGYYPATGGITASLRRAIQAANLWLFQQNGAVSPEKQLLAGVIAAVIRDEDLFLAQAGPTALYGGLNGHVRRYPAESTWLDEPQPLQADNPDAVLGAYHYVEPLISHLQTQPGDVIVLADGRLARQMTLATVAQAILERKSVEVISQNLARITQIQHCSAMVIKVAAGEPVRTPVAAASAKRVVEPAQAQAEVVAEGQKRFTFAMPSVFQKRGEVSVSEPTPYRTGDDFDFEPSEDEVADRRPEALAADQSAAPFQPGQILQQIMAAAFGVLSFLGSGLQTILKLVLPGAQVEGKETKARPAGSSTPAVEQKQPSARALKYVALILPLVVVAVALAVYWFKGYGVETEYANIIAMAQQKFAEAQNVPPENALPLLAEAEAQLGVAETIKTDQPEIDQLQLNIVAQRDEIGKVERLYYIPELARFDEPGTDLNRVIVQGVDVYVLDTGLDRVIYHRLDDLGDALLEDVGDPQILVKGQQFDGITINDTIDMVWMPAAEGRQTADLLILTPDTLVEFNPDWGAGPIPLSGLGTWQTPVAVSSYFGNFYVLDNQANLIYRYLPTLDGYETPAESYFADPGVVNLTGAVDMAIDGTIYVLYQNGEIKRFLGGQPTDFQLRGLDVPLNNPTSIFTAPDEQVQFLYVADAGNQRIVQFSKDGEFMRQFKPRLEDEAAFNDLRSVFVDEISEKIFVLNGSSLYAPNIPVR